MKPSILRVLVATVLLVALPASAIAATEIQFWHAMTAVLGERVNDIAAKFNASQSEYVVKAVHKGSYPETLNAAIAAYRAKQPPHVVQVFEVGTQTMLSSGAVYPGLSAHEGQRGRDRLERFDRTGEELLLDRRQPLLDGVQLVDADPVLQQGSLQEGRARRQGADDLGRGRGMAKKPRPPA
mgnify:CR=1 FL=1